MHTSNYRITGFTEAADASPSWPTSTDPTAGGRRPRVGPARRRLPLADGGPPAWLADEPAVRQTLAAGAGLVTFSGDKLLGGPQAG